MRLQCFLLAEYVGTDDLGRLEIRGVFDTTTLIRLPRDTRRVIFPDCFLAVRLEWGVCDGEELVLHVELRDAGGESVTDRMFVGVHQIGAADRSQTRTHMVHCEDLTVPAPGAYRLELLANGKVIGEYPIYAIEIDPRS